MCPRRSYRGEYREKYIYVQKIVSRRNAVSIHCKSGIEKLQAEKSPKKKKFRRGKKKVTVFC